MRMATLLKRFSIAAVFVATSGLRGHSQTKPKVEPKTISEPTSIRGHRMGETGHEFLIKSHLIADEELVGGAPYVCRTTVAR